jgi:hypothetical protein
MAPVISLTKQATQIPMFPGFPQYWSMAAITPINAPTPMIPHRVANIFFIFSPFTGKFLNHKILI